MPRESLAAQRRRVARADLRFDDDDAHSEEGLPVGNGRMGSLVWTTPSSLHLQINRPDVYAAGAATDSFPIGDTDYAYACGFVDVDFADFGPDVFPPGRTRQHLSVFEGLASLEGRGVNARVHAWTERDVMAVQVTDTRPRPEAVGVNLRMLRYNPQYLLHVDPDNQIPLYEGMFVDKSSSEVRTAHHTAASRLLVRDGRIVLVQQFEEGDYYCASAVAIAIVGRKAQARQANETTLRLTARPGAGTFTVFIASAATFDRAEDVAAGALEALDAAAAAGFAGVLRSSRTWWRNFWSRSHVSCHSRDGAADEVEKGYTFYLYLMAATSRGKLPPNFGGMLWSTGGDPRAWGSCHWWHNTSCYYRALPQADCMDLMTPVFNMYTGMAPRCALAARQVWDSEGLFIPETTWFDGPAPVPDDLATEMADLYLMRKPWARRSDRFREYVEMRQSFPAVWNWKTHEGRWVDGRWTWTDKGRGPFGHVTHIFSTTAKLAYQYWLVYEHTMDRRWLDERAYPMIRGAAEFYRTFPNLRKGRDGRYHIHHVNNHEANWDSTDTIEELTAMHGSLPVAIRASELLAKLAPLPTRRLGDGRRCYAGLNPVVFFDLVTRETPDVEKHSLAEAAFFPEGVPADAGHGQFHHEGIAAARLGRADAVRTLIPNQVLRDPRGVILRNRLGLAEGFQALEAQRLGRASEALQLAACQCVPPGPGGEPVLSLFPAWPAQWEGDFRLLIRGGFMVSSSIHGGQIGPVEIESRHGGPCRLRNPCGPEAEVALRRGRGKPARMSGPLLVFHTRAGERAIIRKA
ncbi:MAG: glycoside hydrolase [Planctomycetota bacterium]|nr:glycoside hydrolase [Planctomycetota bacterium]